MSIQFTRDEIGKILWLLGDYMEELEFSNDHAGIETINNLMEKFETLFDNTLELSSK